MFLKAVRFWYNNLFLNNNFSEFAYLGDLSQYHLTDIRNLLGASWKVEITVYDMFQLTTFSNKNFLYIIYYSASGEFIQLKEERWIKGNLKFNYDVKPENLFLKQEV